MKRVHCSITNFTLFLLFVLTVTVFITGCNTQPKPVEKQKKIEKQITSLNQVSYEISTAITDKFWKNRQDKAVEFDIRETKPKTQEHMVLSQSISKRIQHKLNEYPQLTVVPHDAPYKKCTIYLYLFQKDNKNRLQIKIATPNRSLFFVETYILDHNMISVERKKDGNSIRQRVKQKAKLRITANSKGLTDNLKRGYAWSKRVDQVGYYPLKQSCWINGKALKLVNDKFFDGNIDPGVHTLEISFKGGNWDSRSKQQNILTDLMSARKTFRIRENEILDIELFFYFDGQLGAIEINPFGDFSQFDGVGKVIKIGNKKDIALKNKRDTVKQYSFSKKDLKKINEMISTYSKIRIINLILSKNNEITLSTNNGFITVDYNPNSDLVNNKTVFIDFKKMGITPTKAEQLIVTQINKQKIAREKEAERRKIVLEEQRIAREKKQRIAREKEAERMRLRAAAVRRLTAKESKTQLKPHKHVQKAKTYLRRTLKDPQSLQIDSVSEPRRIILSDSALGLAEGQILWVSEMCYNAKNTYGGYVGIECHKFYFRDGEVVYSY